MPLYRVTYTYDAIRQDGRGFLTEHVRHVFRASGPGHAQVLCRIVVEDLGGRNLEIAEVEEVAVAEGDPL